jgi:hypothetical protein
MCAASLSAFPCCPRRELLARQRGGHRVQQGDHPGAACSSAPMGHPQGHAGSAGMRPAAQPQGMLAGVPPSRGTGAPRRTASMGTIPARPGKAAHGRENQSRRRPTRSRRASSPGVVVWLGESNTFNDLLDPKANLAHSWEGLGVKVAVSRAERRNVCRAPRSCRIGKRGAPVGKVDTVPLAASPSRRPPGDPHGKGLPSARARRRLCGQSDRRLCKRYRAITAYCQVLAPDAVSGTMLSSWTYRPLVPA